MSSCSENEGCQCNSHKQPENTPQSPPVEPPATTGSLTDPYVQERLQAAAKGSGKKKRVKAKKTVAIKQATAFGEINKQFESVEREVVKTPEEEKSEAIKKELDAQLEGRTAPSEAALTAGIQSGGANQMAVPEDKREEVKKLRDQLSGLWSVASDPKKGSENDTYIDGVDSDEATATKNPNPGDSGVRISFKRGKK